MMRFYDNVNISVTEGVRGFCGDRGFQLMLQKEHESFTSGEPSPLNVEIHLSEHEFRDLVSKLKDVWEKGK
jgi:hypothetical protein